MLLTVGIVGIATTEGIKNYLFMRSALPANGIIIGLAPRTGIGRREPMFEFRTQQGETVRAASRVLGRQPVVLVGGEVDVLYLPQNPEHAEINDWRNFWLQPIAFGFLGMMFLFVGNRKFNRSAQT